MIDDRKYTPGTILKCIDKFTEDFSENDILIVKYSKKYPGTYTFENKPDYGWSVPYIEDTTNFIVVPQKIKFFEALK